MKKMHILGIAIVLIAIALIISASKDMSTYATFTDAQNSESSFRVVGTLEKDKEMYYNPADKEYWGYINNLEVLKYSFNNDRVNVEFTCRAWS